MCCNVALQRSQEPLNRWGEADQKKEPTLQGGPLPDMNVSKNGGFPQQPWGFPTKNDQHLGCEMGVALFLETPIEVG